MLSLLCSSLFPFLTHNVFHMIILKHVASNAYTKYRPYPTTAQFAASQDLISRTTTFLRRELQIWEGLDVEVKLHLCIFFLGSDIETLLYLVPDRVNYIIDEIN